MHECRLLSHFESHRCAEFAKIYTKIRVPSPHEKVKYTHSSSLFRSEKTARISVVSDPNTRNLNRF
jgi:hypothetical protein